MLNDDSEETPGFDTVDHPVIECKGQRHHLSDRDFSVPHYRAILYLRPEGRPLVEIAVGLPRLVRPEDENP